MNGAIYSIRTIQSSKRITVGLHGQGCCNRGDEDPARTRRGPGDGLITPPGGYRRGERHRALSFFLLTIPLLREKI